MHKDKCEDCIACYTCFGNNPGGDLYTVSEYLKDKYIRDNSIEVFNYCPICGENLEELLNDI